MSGRASPSPRRGARVVSANLKKGGLVETLSRKRLLIPLALLSGVCLAILLAPKVEFDDMSWSTLGSSPWLKDLEDLIAPAREFFGGSFCDPEQEKQSVAGREFLPVVLIPGIWTTSLTSWSMRQPATFRKKVWGTTGMVSQVLSNRKAWMDYIALDLNTGLDREGYTIRANTDFDAASEFIQGYWVWAKVIESLACIGYDPNMVQLQGYDWRLSYQNLEIRDGYFTRLKRLCEYNLQRTGQKTVLVGHSMGSTVILYFLKWVEAESGGGGGEEWVERHVQSFTSIGGAFLGVPKAMAALISGEVRDTVNLAPIGSYVLDKFFSKDERLSVFRGWPGLASLLLKGGDRVWGSESAPDDPENATDTHAHFVTFKQTSSRNEADLDRHSLKPNLTVAQSLVDLVIGKAPKVWQKVMSKNYSAGFESDPAVLKANNEKSTKWTNPLEVTLPKAPSLTVHCLYGVGKMTERSYWYTPSKGSEKGLADPNTNSSESDYNQNQSLAGNTDYPTIDFELHLPNHLPTTENGVRLSEGDGTVSLLSLGGMCLGWQRQHSPWNPHGVKVVVQEFKHDPEPLIPRGGRSSGDHIDILGSTALNHALYSIITKQDLPERIISNIRTIADRIQWS